MTYWYSVFDVLFFVLLIFLDKNPEELIVQKDDRYGDFIWIYFSIC